VQTGRGVSSTARVGPGVRSDARRAIYPKLGAWSGWRPRLRAGDARPIDRGAVAGPHGDRSRRRLPRSGDRSARRPAPARRHVGSGVGRVLEPGRRRTLPGGQRSKPARRTRRWSSSARPATAISARTRLRGNAPPRPRCRWRAARRARRHRGRGHTRVTLSGSPPRRGTRWTGSAHAGACTPTDRWS